MASSEIETAVANRAGRRAGQVSELTVIVPLKGRWRRSPARSYCGSGESPVRLRVNP